MIDGDKEEETSNNDEKGAICVIRGNKITRDTMLSNNS